MSIIAKIAFWGISHLHFNKDALHKIIDECDVNGNGEIDGAEIAFFLESRVRKIFT